MTDESLSDLAEVLAETCVVGPSVAFGQCKAGYHQKQAQMVAARLAERGWTLTHSGGPLPLHNRPDGTPCNYAAMTKSNGQWVCTKCGAGGSANGGSDG